MLLARLYLQALLLTTTLLTPLGRQPPHGQHRRRRSPEVRRRRTARRRWTPYEVVCSSRYGELRAGSRFCKQGASDLLVDWNGAVSPEIRGTLLCEHPGEWRPLNWGECTDECGSGVRHRQFACADKDGFGAYCNTSAPRETMACEEPSEYGYPISTDVSSMMYGIGGVRDWIHWLGIVLVSLWCLGSVAGAALFARAQKQDPVKANDIAMVCLMQQMFSGCALLVFSGAAWWNERRAGWFYLPHCLVDGADPKVLGPGFPFFCTALPAHVVLTAFMAFGPMLGDVQKLRSHYVAILNRRQATRLLHDVVAAPPIPAKDSKLANHESFKLLVSWENGSTQDLHLDDCHSIFSSHSRVNAFITVRFQAADVFTDKAMEKTRYTFTCCLNGKELEDLTPPSASPGAAQSRTVHLQLLVIRHMLCRHSPLLNSYIPQWLANLFFGGMLYAVWDNFWGVPTVTFHIEKKVRILPHQDLNDLLEGTESSKSPSQVATVEEWRVRALDAIVRLPPYFMPGALRLGCRGKSDAASASSSAEAPAAGPASALSACLDEVKLSQRGGGLTNTSSAKAAEKKPASPKCRQPDSEVLPGVMPAEIVPTSGSGSHPPPLQVDDRSGATILGIPASSSWDSSPSAMAANADADPHERWYRNMVVRRDWAQLILKAECWLIRSHLRISSAGFDEVSSAERAAEIFVTSWQARRLLPAHSQFKPIFDEIWEAFNQDFRQALACLDIDRLDRLKALSDRAKDCPDGDSKFRMIDSRLGDVLVWHGRHMLEFAVKIGDRKALALAMIQSERICDDDILKVAHSDDRMAMDFLFSKARDMYRDKLYRDTHHMLSTDAGQELLGDQQESFRSAWVDKQLKPGHDFFANPRLKDEVESPEFLRRVQALFDLTSRDVLTRDRQNSSIPLRLEVVRVKRSINLNTYKGYYARRREIQESLSGRKDDLPEIPRGALTVSASGCWASRALRQAQGIWVEADAGQGHSMESSLGKRKHLLVRGQKVFDAAHVAACCLSPSMAEKLVTRHVGDLSDWSAGNQSASAEPGAEREPVLCWSQPAPAAPSPRTKIGSPRSHFPGGSSSGVEDADASMAKVSSMLGCFSSDASSLYWVPPDSWPDSWPASTPSAASSALRPAEARGSEAVALEVQAATPLVPTAVLPAAAELPRRAHWVRAPSLMGEWIVGGRYLYILPPSLFAAGADLVDRTRGLDSYTSRVAGRVLRAPHGRAWFAAEQERLTAMAASAGRDAPEYLLHLGDRLYPLWLEAACPASSSSDSTTSFVSLTFRGHVDHSGLEIFVQSFGNSPTTRESRASTKVMSMLSAAASSSTKSEDPFGAEEIWGYRPCYVVELSARELDRRCNELYLFHGTREAAAESITDADFRVNLAGSHRGTMFGPGIYMADSVTKSDEYTEEDAHGLRTIVICRCTMGRMLEQCDGGRMCLSRCQRGGYHSVLGLRAYNEYVVYDEQQVYAEYIVWYKRLL